MAVYSLKNYTWGTDYSSSVDSNNYSVYTTEAQTDKRATFCGTSEESVFNMDTLKSLYDSVQRTTGREYLTYNPRYSTTPIVYPYLTDSNLNYWNDSTSSSFSNLTGSWINTTSIYGNYTDYNLVPNKRSKLLQKIRGNLSSAVRVRGEGICQAVPENEQVAIETLREEITEAELRKYLKYGFVLVPGESGKTYQIFRNNWHTKVWSGGKLVEEVCVRIASNAKVPPTDNVIAFKKMIEADEESFRKCGNVYKMEKRVA